MYFGDVIDALTLFFLCEITFGKKQYRINRYLSLAIMILVHIGWDICQSFIISTLLYFFIGMCIMLAQTYLYKGNLARHFFAAISITVIGSASEFIVYSIQNGLGVITKPSEYIFGMIITKIIALMIITLMRVVLKRNLGFKNRHFSFFILTCELISASTLVLMLYILPQIPDSALTFFGLIAILILILNILIYYIFDSLSEIYILREEKLLANENLKKAETQYQLITNNYKNVRSIIHDSNKHLTSLRMYIEKGLLSDAIKYLDESRNEINNVYAYINTGNVVIDALVSELKNKCELDKIECQIDIAINNNEITLDAHDLAVILGNLFDNAYNAVICVESNEKRYINLKIIDEEQKIIINIENSHINKTIKKSYGIQNIEKMVEKYGGMYFTDIQDEKYTASIVIPLFES